MLHEIRSEKAQGMQGFILQTSAKLTDIESRCTKGPLNLSRRWRNDQKSMMDFVQALWHLQCSLIQSRFLFKTFKYFRDRGILVQNTGPAAFTLAQKGIDLGLSASLLGCKL